MVSGTAEAAEQLENVRIVVQQSALLNKVVELCARAHEDTLVKVLLRRSKLKLADGDGGRRQLDILLPLCLGPSQHELAQQVVAQELHRMFALAHVAVPLDGVDDVLVEVRIVAHGGVAAVVTAAERPLQRLAAAALCLAKVVRERADPQKANKRVQLADAVLQRGPGETPAVAVPAVAILLPLAAHSASQRQGRFGGRVDAILDLVGFVQHNAVPSDGVQQRGPKVDAVFVHHIPPLGEEE
mmetsp:Transcript_3407/g.10395  ORF Transcript_3407/g.10395 Transcript_3407/m.10395 type:complete len:242 (-) Transcript_3407:580-1305(-)